MQITLNDQGYIESYALIGGLVDGVEIEAPDDLLEDFKQHPEAYKLEDGVLVLDADMFLFSVRTAWQLDERDNTGEVLDERYRVIVAF